jgi:hypothetical protein
MIVMAEPKRFQWSWVHVTAIGFVLLSSSFAWFYFRELPVVQKMPKFFDYRPSVIRTLASLSGVALFVGGLGFGFMRLAHRFMRRLLSPGPRVR